MGMAIKNPVIVMALYDIGRDNWNSFNLSYNTYLFWMKNTLSLDVPIVIYSEKKFIDEIKEARKKYDPDFSKTKILEVPLEDLDCYKLYHERLSNLMHSAEFESKVQTKVPEMNQPLYNVIMFNKVFFLKDAKRFFEGDLYIWADAGGLRENISYYENKKWPCLSKINELDNSKVTFFSHSKNITVQDKQFHALSQIRFIQGTAFFAPINLIDSLLTEFNETIEECLNSGFIGSDEKIFDITYCKNREAYNLIKCDWRTYFNIFKSDGSSLFDKNGNQSKSIFLDLGTHECQGLRRFIDKLDMDKSWEIHAFEPNPLVDSEEFIKYLDHYNISIHKKAVWKRSGHVIFNQYGKNGKGQGSLLEETGGGDGYNDFYDEKIIECVDILNFIKKLDSHKDIYIKMDIEWSEYEVVQRMLEDWPKNIKKIWIEWHGISDTKKLNKAKELENKIKSHGVDLENL